MRTKDFCDLVEKAMREEYGESEFATVPYLPDGSPVQQMDCLGIFLLEDSWHMAVVAARAMYLIWQDDDAMWNTDQDKDEALGDFCDLMATMCIAPYMQWHCAYFPGLTAEQLNSENDEVDDGAIDPVDGSFVPSRSRWLSEQLFAEFDNLPDVDVLWYSGLIDAECVAISGSESDVRNAWSTVLEGARRNADEATVTMLNNLSTDSFGHEMVMYFPDFQKGER